MNTPEQLYEAGERHGGRRSNSAREVQWDRFSDLIPAANELGISPTPPIGFESRPSSIRLEKVGDYSVRITRHDDDARPVDWVDAGKCFYRMFAAPKERVERVDLSELVRLTTIMDGDALAVNSGWYVKDVDGRWIYKHPASIPNILESELNIPRSQTGPLIGREEITPWHRVRIPFQAEYPQPGARIWNLGAPQFKFEPEPGTNWEVDAATWAQIFAHATQDLAGYLPESIPSPAHYLLYWFASICQRPSEPLPYLFLFGPENSGKSIIHEAFDLLVTRGVVKADRSLTSDFNGEIENSILCVVEEKDIKKSGVYNRIKEMVTTLRIPIRRMNTDQYSVENYTHWIQCANNRENCPVFDGQTRITVMHVPALQAEIPKPALLRKLEAEAPKFIWHLLNTRLPPSDGRLGIPVIQTETTRQLQAENRHPMVSAIPTLDLPWSGTGGELADACGVAYPRDLREVRKVLSNNHSYLHQNGIAVEFGDNRRKAITLKRSL